MAYSPTMMRWLQQDPMGYVDGANDYLTVDDNPEDGTDPLGLWTVKRDGGDRADAIPDKGDTIESLAKVIHLSASEAQKWLIVTDPSGRKLTVDLQPNTSLGTLCGDKFTVPNTAYIDAGDGHASSPEWWQWEQISTKQTAWQQEGLKVVYTTNSALTMGTLETHLMDKNLYKYLYVGDGNRGSLLVMGGQWVDAGDYSSYGIAEMTLAAPGTHDDETGWQTNVSKLGTLTTYTNLTKTSFPTYTTAGSR